MWIQGDKTFKEENSTMDIEDPNIEKGYKFLILDHRYAEQIEQYLQMDYGPQKFPELLECVQSQDILKQHYGIIGIRKLVSVENDPSIQSVIEAGLVARFISYSKQEEYPQLQLQAIWALANVASGTHSQCQAVVDEGAIPIFLNILSADKECVIEEAVWGLGNLLGDCPEIRDLIIACGGVEVLALTVEKYHAKKSVFSHGAWALSNICRGTPLPEYNQIKRAIPLLVKLLAEQKISDPLTATDCLWALGYHIGEFLGEENNEVDSRLLLVLVKNLTSAQPSILLPSARNLGEILVESNPSAQLFVAYNGVNQLFQALDHPKTVARRQLCWMLSNFCACSKQSVNAITSNQLLVKKLAEMFHKDEDKVRSELCYVFLNFLWQGDTQTALQIFKQNSIIECYLSLLEGEDSSFAKAAVDCLKRITQMAGELATTGNDSLAQLLFECQSAGKLEVLMGHQDGNVSAEICSLLSQMNLS